MSIPSFQIKKKSNLSCSLWAKGNVFGSSDENKETLIEDWEGVDTIFKQLDVPFRVNMNIDDMTKIMNSS